MVTILFIGSFLRRRGAGVSLPGVSLGTLRYDDGKPLRRQRKDGKNWVEVAVLARNLGCYEVSKTATSKHKHSP